MQNPNLSIALQYAEAGMYLFPAIYKKKRHLGLIKWGNNSSNDPKDIKRWASLWPDCYFCLNCRKSDVTVLDIDNKNGKDGSAALEELLFENAEELPGTVTVKTPSGGFHYIFSGSSAFTVGKLGEGIDTPVMIPLPGTTIKDKGAYVLQNGYRQHAPFPQWLLDTVGKHTPRVSTQDLPPLVELDEPVYVSKAALYLADEAPVAIEGDGGDLTTYTVACKVRDFGISREKCVELMLDGYNERCEPPWDPKELMYKIESAYTYAQNPAGSVAALSAEAEFNDLTPSNGPQGLKRFALKPPERKWIIPGWLPEGEITALYGDGGLGKSLLAVQLGMNVASGAGKFLGQPLVGAMPVLYVTCEDTKDEAHRRIHDIMRAPEYEFMDYDVPFFVWSRVGEDSILGHQEGSMVRMGIFYKELSEQIKRIGGGDSMLVVLDVVSDIFAIDENNRQVVSQCVKTILGGLVKDLNCTILFLAHPSKASTKDGTHSSGSTAWRNSVRSMWVLIEHENKNLKDYRYLKITKSNYAAKTDPMMLRWDKGRLKAAVDEVIVDRVGEDNLAIIYELIEEQQVLGNALGTHHQSKPCIYKLDIAGGNGGMLTKAEIEWAIGRLIREGLISNTTGMSRGNGLRTTDKRRITDEVETSRDVFTEGGEEEV